MCFCNSQIDATHCNVEEFIKTRSIKISSTKTWLFTQIKELHYQIYLGKNPF